MYRFVATSISGYIQQLAICYIRNGYFFYVTGNVPEGKDPAAVDAKLLDRYGIDRSRWARARRRKAGEASIQYLRYRRFFALLATHGSGPFFEQERGAIRDVRREPLKCFGYAVSHKDGHPHVRIAHHEFRMLQEHFRALALSRRVEQLAREFQALPFEPYAPVRRQLFSLLRAVNGRRKRAGFPPLEASCLRLRRAICRPFDPVEHACRHWEAYFARFPQWVSEQVGNKEGGDEFA